MGNVQLAKQVETAREAKATIAKHLTKAFANTPPPISISPLQKRHRQSHKFQRPQRALLLIVHWAIRFVLRSNFHSRHCCCAPVVSWRCSRLNSLRLLCFMLFLFASTRSILPLLLLLYHPQILPPRIGAIWLLMLIRRLPLSECGLGQAYFAQ